MGSFLHSLPWTLALALAQAGDTAALPLSIDDSAPAAAEDGLAPGESPAPSLLSLNPDAASLDLSLED